MDATTDQIKREIEEARERISESTSQLGERIRQTFDWRQQVGEHPWAAVGIVAGAGFLLGAASAKMLGRGLRAAPRYGEQYTYDRIGRDVEAQAPSGGETPREPGRPHEAEPERREAGQPPSGFARTGVMAGLLASLGAAIEPQLKEIGRNLAEQVKDLSTHFIGQGKEVMKQKVDRWRSGSEGRSARARPPSTSATTPGVEDTRDTRAPQSRESAV